MSTDRAHNILCVGISPGLQQTRVLDRLTPGGVHRVTAPVEETAAGKAVNAARVLKVLGSTPCVCGFIGGPRGERVCEHLDEAGVEHHFTEVAHETRVCMTLVDDSTATEIIDPVATPAPADWFRLEQDIASRWDGTRVIVLAGKMLPGGPDESYGRLVADATAHGCVSIVDTQGPALLAAAAAGATVCKMNADELIATLDLDASDDATLLAGTHRLLEIGAKHVLLTRGAEGAWLVSRDAALRATAPQVDVRNAVGSGDASSAGLAHAMAHGHTPAEALPLAMACGAANAASLTAADVDPELARDLQGAVSVEALSS